MTSQSETELKKHAELALRLKRFTQFGWAGTALGCLLWGWGYFTTGSLPFVNWSSFAPHWISEFLANWQEEFGMLIMLVASIPLYYAQLKALPSDE